MLNLNIIGSKDILKHNVDEYIRKVNQLSKNIKALPKIDDISNLDILINLDNVMIMSYDIETIIKSYTVLKKNCIMTGIFLSGTLSAIHGGIRVSIEDKKDSNCHIQQINYTSKSNVNSVNAKNEIINFLSQHYSFKGIGVKVDLPEYTINNYIDCFAKSYYTPIKENTHLLMYYDIRQPSINDVELRGAIKQFTSYKTRNNSQLRYFIPLFVNYINSIDYGNFKIENGRLALNSTLAEYILDGLLFDKISDKKLPTFKSLYFVFLNAVYINIDNNTITLAILKKLISKRIVRDNIDKYLYDDRIICSKAKSLLMNDLIRISDDYEF